MGMYEVYRIITPGDPRPHWQGDRAPTEEEVEEIADEWESGLKPAEYPQLMTDYLLVQRQRLFGWKTMRTVYLIDFLEAARPE